MHHGWKILRLQMMFDVPSYKPPFLVIFLHFPMTFPHFPTVFPLKPRFFIGIPLPNDRASCTPAHLDVQGSPRVRRARVLRCGCGGCRPGIPDFWAKFLGFKQTSSTTMYYYWDIEHGEYMGI